MKKTCFPFYMLSLWGSDDIYMAESEKILSICLHSLKGFATFVP